MVERSTLRALANSVADLPISLSVAQRKQIAAMVKPTAKTQIKP
jgi:hypothetical protein